MSADIAAAGAPRPDLRLTAVRDNVADGMAGLLAHGSTAPRLPSRAAWPSGVATGRFPFTVAGAAAAYAPRSLFIFRVEEPSVPPYTTRPPTPSKVAALSLTLVLGGARSGKSRYAEALVSAHPPPWRYIATAQAFDDEMRDRIAQHRQARAGGLWETVEEPIALPEALAAEPETPALVDCLTLWLSNLLLGDHDPAAAGDALEAALGRREGPTVLVANEVGLGIVPENALARRFRDEAGRLSQRLAARADHVALVVAGIPMRVK